MLAKCGNISVIRRGTLFLALAFIAQPAWGTIVLYSLTADRAVVAADSLGSNAGAGTYKTACKIVELDRRTFFFGWGNASASRDWSADEISRQAFTEAKTGNDRLMETATIWADTIIAKYKSNPLPANRIGSQLNRNFWEP